MKIFSSRAAAVHRYHFQTLDGF